MNDTEVQERWRALDDKAIQDLCDGIRSHEKEVHGYLCEIIASVCDVDKDSLLTSTENVSLAHARWLFWYTLRFITNDTYEKMAASIKHEYGYSFRARSITSGVNKMARMVTRDELWKDRWRIIRHILGLRTPSKQQTINFMDDTKGKVLLVVPRALKNKVDIKYID